MNRLLQRSIVLVVVTVLLMACAGSPSGSSAAAPGSFGVMTKVVGDTWAAAVKIENLAEAQDKSIFTITNEKYMALKTKYPLLEQCYKNWSTAAVDVVTGRYDTNAGSKTDKPSGQVNTPALINALVVNEGYPGSLDECNRNVTAYGNEVTAFRQSRIDAYVRLWEIKRDLDTVYTGDLSTAFVTQMLQFAGNEYMRSDVSKRFAPPKFWFPTFNLEASIYEPGQCQDFINYYPGQALWNPAVKECKLIGQAAYDVIFRPVLSAEVRDMRNSGIDNLNPTK